MLKLRVFAQHLGIARSMVVDCRSQVLMDEFRNPLIEKDNNRENEHCKNDCRQLCFRIQERDEGA
jgi:hypothetical protein